VHDRSCGCGRHGEASLDSCSIDPVFLEAPSVVRQRYSKSSNAEEDGEYEEDQCDEGAQTGRCNRSAEPSCNPSCELSLARASDNLL
jgi:hypothetical protein